MEVAKHRSHLRTVEAQLLELAIQAQLTNRRQGHMLDADTARTHQVHTGDINRLKIRLILRRFITRAGWTSGL